jgi:hypothetical protein
MPIRIRVVIIHVNRPGDNNNNNNNDHPGGTARGTLLHFAVTYSYIRNKNKNRSVHRQEPEQLAKLPE